MSSAVPYPRVALNIRAGSSAVTSLTCSVFSLTHLGLVPKRRNGSVLQVFVDPTIRTQARRQFSRLLNGTKGYHLSHYPHPADEVHNRSDLLLPTMALQGSCPCNSCVEQTTIHSLGQKHHRNHLLVGQEALHPTHHARPGDHRNRIIYTHGHTSGFTYRSSVSFLTVSRLRVTCILPNYPTYDARMAFTLVLLIFSVFPLIIILASCSRSCAVDLHKCLDRLCTFLLRSSTIANCGPFLIAPPP